MLLEILIKMKILKGLYRNGFDIETKDVRVQKKVVKRIIKFLKKIELRSESRSFKNGKCFNNKTTSYGFKHTLERACGFSVANGNLIQAMHEYGFEIKRIKNSINVFFNLSKEEIKYLSKLNN